jgi:hypothetical protein
MMEPFVGAPLHKQGNPTTFSEFLYRIGQIDHISLMTESNDCIWLGSCPRNFSRSLDFSSS